MPPRRPLEPMRPLQAEACSCGPRALVDDDTCTFCGRLLPDDPALETATVIAAAAAAPPRPTAGVPR